MNHRPKVSPRRRMISMVLAVTSATLGILVTTNVLSVRDSAAASELGFSQTKTVERDHLVNGTDDVVDTRTVTVTADTTTSLRERQNVHITWSGAHPTGGVVYDDTAQYAANQEYPVAILQCRGVDSSTVPVADQVSPETCFTPTPEQRYQPPYKGAFPAYRLDRYATAADRALSVGAPADRPAACDQPDGFDAEHWVPFDAADGTVYYGGSSEPGCPDLSPEQSVSENPLQPASTTWGTTNLQGDGSADFIVQTAQANPSLGCSDTVACTIEVIPIMGISCDAAGSLVPAQDQPSDPAAAYADCSQTGYFAPGVPGTDSSGAGASTLAELPVTGELWWSASNWRNRITIPLTFAPSASVCNLSGSGSSILISGAESLAQATQQWAPSLCLGQSPFELNHAALSNSVEAKSALSNALSDGSYDPGAEAAFQEEPPDAGEFTNPIVQAPTAVTGFAISYLMDDAKGHQYLSLKLDARLLAKLLTMSYPAYGDVQAGEPALANNPLDMALDPEFLALNPGMSGFLDGGNFNQLAASATLFTTSGNSDVMTALTSYINSDPDARAWLDGTPDPWGMVVNPAYKKIALPTPNWPQLDSYVSAYEPDPRCGSKPILPLVAAPISDPSQVAANMQYGITNSQVQCVTQDQAGTDFKLAAQGRQEPGIRFQLGLVSLADADRYGLNTAALQTQKSSAAPALISDLSGLSFAAPNDASLQAAADLMVPDAMLGTWTLPYDAIRTDPADANAYPGTMLVSTDVPTEYLSPSDAVNFAHFLDFVAGPGQTPGVNNGQLPPGYLPITAANGLSSFVAYTTAAAAAVAAQAGDVPSVTGAVPESVPPPGAAPVLSPTDASIQPNASAVRSSSTAASEASAAAVTKHPTPVASSAPESDIGLTAPGIVGVGSRTQGNVTDATHTIRRAASAPAAATAAPTAPGATPQVLLGDTQNQAPGPLSLTLPVLLGLALLSGLASAWVSGIGRRR